MNFGFTEEQELLRAQVRKFLDQSCPLEEVRRISESPSGLSRPLWKQVCELGWAGLTVPEQHGGAGLGFVDWVVVLEETGRSLFPSPLISTTLAAATLVRHGSESQRARWLPALADGSAIGTLAFLEESDRLDEQGITLRGEASGDAVVLHGEKWFVGDAAAADLFVVAFRGEAGVALALVESSAPGVRVEAVPGMDLTKRSGRLRLDGVRVSQGELLAGAGWPAVAALYDLAAFAVSAEAIGAAEAALSLTVGYARQRIQFGEPIGRFQGVKHPLAEMHVDIESWKSLVYFAAWAIDESAAEVPAAVSRAKAYASDAFARIGVDCVQLHGGIGYTWEYDAQLFLKRSKWTRPAYGDADHHYGRVAGLGGL